MAIRRRKFRFEQLEDRKMRAADITLSGGIVEITGTDGADVAEVRFDEDDVRIELTYPDGSGTDNINRRYDIEDVTQLHFHGGEGDDQMIMVVDELDNGVTLNHILAYFYGEGDNDTFDNQTNIRSYVYGGEGNDTLLGGSSRDYFYGEQGNDMLNGRAGNDYYRFPGANLGSDTIAEAAGQGTDTIQLYGLELTNGTEWDSTYLNLGATYEQYVYYALNGEHFKLTLNDGEAMERAFGTNGTDYLIGNGQNNGLFGGGGDDWLWGYGGDDYLSGENGNDFLWGDQGSDRLFGGDDQDVLFGDEYDWSPLGAAWYDSQDANGHIDVQDIIDSLQQSYGAADLKELDDALHSQLASTENAAQYGERDYLYGGYGTDLAYGGSGDDFIRGGGDDDVVIGGGGNDDLHGDFSWNSTYRQGVDFLFGMAGDDDLFGRGGNDRLFGGDGQDDLQGHEGDDVLYGRYDGERDNMNGGAGRDTFVRYYYDWGWISRFHAAEEKEEDYTYKEDTIDKVYL